MLNRKRSFELTATGHRALPMDVIGRGVRCMHSPAEGWALKSVDTLVVTWFDIRGQNDEDPAPTTLVMPAAPCSNG